MANSEGIARLGKKRITAVVLCFNEEVHVAELVPLLRATGLSVIVVDSGSTDKTVEVAKKTGATVYEHAWVNYSQQFNWGLGRVDPAVEWVLRIDADERPSFEMQRLLRQLTDDPNSLGDATGCSFLLGIWFMGRRLRYGGVSRLRQLRLFRNGHGECESLNMDEHIKLANGYVENRNEVLDHFAVGSYQDWITKHIGYASREARDTFESFSDSLGRGELPKDHPAYWRRASKIHLYYRAPLFARAFLLWVYRYFVLCGWMDGVPGFIYHFFQCLWYRILVDFFILERRGPNVGKLER